jgi:UDP-glucuronate 4-epimerase
MLSKMEFEGGIECLAGREAGLEFEARHPADVLATRADIGKAERLLGWWLQVGFEEGVRRLVDWYRENRAWAKDVVTA